MAISAKNYNDNKKIQKNNVYRIDSNKNFIIRENQNDSTEDIVICMFEEVDSENYFCLEYRPEIVAAQGHKAADLFAFSIINSKNAINAYIYDVKRSFKADSEILHYVEQINSTYKDAKGVFESIRDNRYVLYKIGVITGNYDGNKILEQAKYYQNQVDELEKESSNIAFIKSKALELPNLKRKAKVLKEIAEKTLVLEDGTEFELDDVRLVKKEEGNYVGNLYI
jgi:hypothetical protein